MEVGRRHPASYPKGGLSINGDNDTGAIKEVLANGGRKIIEVNVSDVMKMSRPASLS